MRILAFLGDPDGIDPSIEKQYECAIAVTIVTCPHTTGDRLGTLFGSLDKHKGKATVFTVRIDRQYIPEAVFIRHRPRLQRRKREQEHNRYAGQYPHFP